MFSQDQLQDRVRQVAEYRLFKGRCWLFCLGANIFAALFFSVMLVWCNIERTDLSYFINVEGSRCKEKQEMHAKLLAERESLLSPSELSARAQKLGMKPAPPGKIRRLDKGKRQ